MHFAFLIQIKFYLHMHFFRIIAPTNIPTQTSSNESTHFTDIIGDDDRQTTLQGTKKKIVTL